MHSHEMAPSGFCDSSQSLSSENVQFSQFPSTHSQVMAPSGFCDSSQSFSSLNVQLSQFPSTHSHAVAFSGFCDLSHVLSSGRSPGVWSSGCAVSFTLSSEHETAVPHDAIVTHRIARKRFFTGRMVTSLYQGIILYFRRGIAVQPITRADAYLLEIFMSQRQRHKGICSFGYSTVKSFPGLPLILFSRSLTGCFGNVF